MQYEDETLDAEYLHEKQTPVTLFCCIITVQVVDIRTIEANKYTK
jgi:hypothetical protein